MAPVVLLAAHGTRDPGGLLVLEQLAAAVAAARPDLGVRLSYVDVASPSFADALAEIEGAVAVIPLLLSGGYHVRTDIPQVIAARQDVVVAPALGPDRRLSLAMASRLDEARALDPTRGDRKISGSIVMGWAGSSDPSARADAARAARDLGELLHRPVRALALSGPDADFGPRLREIISADGPDLEVANYLLAPGFFADRLASIAHAAGATTVAGPLGGHGSVVELILARFEGLITRAGHL